MDVVVTYFGRTSGTGRILAIDGELNANMPREFGKCFDYFISQAYGCSGDSNLDGRLQSCANYFSEVPFKDVARRFPRISRTSPTAPTAVPTTRPATASR